MAKTGFQATVRRTIHMLCHRRIYVVCMVIVPVAMALFFLSLMGEGLPLKVPTAIVDMDNTGMSRQVTRSLGATELIDIQKKAESYLDAMNSVKRGETFGFFVIPENFEKDALSGRTPTIDFYTNLTYYIPGSLAFKGFKTIAVTTSGAIVKTTLVSAGVGDDVAGTLLQPMVVQDHPMGNPWMNYSIYLSNSFIPGVIALMVMLVTVWSICDEIKRGTSVQWLRSARGSIVTAVAAKLLPQAAIFTVVGIACQALMYGYSNFPLHCNAWHMILAMVLLVVACQGFAVFICGLIPNLRFALSIVSLIGILTFSIAGLSFPVQSMYGSIGIFSYILPLRYYFLIYVDQALNGIPIYYSRYYYAALLVFPLVGASMLWKLKRHCEHPVYVP